MGDRSKTTGFVSVELCDSNPGWDPDPLTSQMSAVFFSGQEGIRVSRGPHGARVRGHESLLHTIPSFSMYFLSVYYEPGATDIGASKQDVVPVLPETAH